MRINPKIASRASTLGVAAAAIALLATTPAALAQKVCDGAELVTPGKLTVAYNGDMPGTGTRDGKLIGIDGDIMTLVAEKLGLEVEPALMEWAAEIESVKSRRVDIMHGMMGWTLPRTEVISMTDPIYFAGSLMTQRKGANITKLDQLKDKRIATVQGFAQVPELKMINPDVKLYETGDAAIRDLVAGRVDVLFLDPPMMQYISIQQPELNIESIPVTDPYDPKMPIITGKFQILFGMSREAPKLEQCINEAIAEIWNTCSNYKLASEYGFTDKFWFTPSGDNPRLGVDRPEDWQYPQLAGCE
ncbi:amino acid ABC transporter substrate-binding protein (PAAT family) [Pseudaminobacter salicylatoxidans]|uniref:Amino acid ABC transporter substrate-binding protein (PAAT family) n=2 Tax=Pseudaminobacter salicylatoxidans TaxID=93369 RepID=A0A316C5P7_PSESE|nr:amino acid ABC transporter substrate-binding protein (PAAT family) [Pseudaminobacter salicylatoxidans]